MGCARIFKIRTSICCTLVNKNGIKKVDYDIRKRASDSDFQEMEDLECLSRKMSGPYSQETFQHLKI